VVSKLQRTGEGNASLRYARFRGLQTSEFFAKRSFQTAWARREKTFHLGF